MQWYYSVNDGQVGPVTDAEFDSLVKAGTISRDTSVWHDGMQDWTRYGDLAPMAAGTQVARAPMPSAMATAPAIGAPVHQCAECGRTFAEPEMIAFNNAWVCATCKPVFVQKLKEGIAPAGPLNYAGFWIRFCAKFVDGIIIAVGNFFVGMAVGLLLKSMGMPREAAMIGGLFGFILDFGYAVYFNGRFGATPGKMALKLKIVRPNGEPISYSRALGRRCAEMLSGFILCIGYLMVIWDNENRALHDRICDTRVIRL